jgi:phage regulator Rha-like protein
MEISTELVHTKRGEIYTTSILVSEKLEVPHNKLLRTIERVIKDYNFHTPPVSTEFQFIETTFTTKMNKTYKSYDMNEQAFIVLVMNL